jgi:ornithine cyclodeaminase
MTVTAFGALADVDTGYPRLISEMTILTAMRTAATSALAAKYMMKKGATRHALIGTGAQGEFQAIALAAVCGLKTVRYFDLSREAMDKFARNMAAFPDIKIIPASSVAEAVADADVITTATAAKAQGVVVAPELVREGMHFNAIGGDCPGKTEFSPEVLRRAKIAVEFEPQTRIEGEIQQLPADSKVTPLWEIVTGKARLRAGDQDITLFDSVGFALEDFAALKFVDALLAELGIDCRIPLVPDVADPRDLFGLLDRGGAVKKTAAS